MSKIRLGVIFGSRSVEHEVSIITVVQLMKNVNREKYDVVPIYIDKQGRWLTGPKLESIEAFKHLELVAQNKSYPLLASPDRENSKELVESKTDRKSTRLNSSHQIISYAVFCLKKKKKTTYAIHSRIKIYVTLHT